MRLPDYAVGIFPVAPSKSALKKLIKKRCIRVDGVIATTATYIRGGESINLIMAETPASSKKLVLPLQVLYEDEYLAALHKPAGILVSGNSFKTLANALEQNLKPSALPDAVAPQPVHRLDYPTTGIVLAGKTSQAISALNKLFEHKHIQKKYYAITIGSMKERGELTTAVDGKPAQAAYKVKARVDSERFGTLNLVELQPQTGRRHQLRKQLQAIGNPVLGDKDYGKDGLILQGKGLYLHAFSLRFKHPISEADIYLEDSLPECFIRIFNYPELGI